MTAARAAAAFQMTVRVRLRMSIACPADGLGVMRLPGLGAENRRCGRTSPTASGEWWNGVEWLRRPNVIRSSETLTEEETRMAIDPKAVGATTEPVLFEWTDRDTLLYALGVGAGLDDLSFTTENSHDITQQVLPTYAVICCPAFGAAGKIGKFNWAMLLHGSQGIRLHAPLPAAGKLSVVTEVADMQDKGEGKNAIVMLRGRGTDPDSGQLIAETLTTLVLRGEGGFGGQPGQRPIAPEFPDREPDTRVALPTREDQALIYRLSGDRNPLHSDPWFARELAGFPKPILHGLCTYGVSGRALVAELGKGVAANVTSIASRFTSPVFPGETLSTLIWRTEPGKAVFRTEVAGSDGASDGTARVVLDDGAVEYVQS